MRLGPLRRLVAAALLTLAASGVSAAELMMVERAGCVWCERWERDVGPAYMKSEEGRRAPLSRHNLDRGQPPLALKEPVRFTPTFILLEDGREIGRITGYLDNAMFWGLLGVLLNKLDQTSAKD